MRRTIHTFVRTATLAMVLAAPLVASPAMAAAGTGGASSTGVSAAASGGVVGCGWNRASCEEDRRIFSRAGVRVSDIYLCDGCTYTPESPKPEGYYFYWGTWA